ncbi:MAG: M3 family metallopeptidase [candidate division Zixibacteria bacterium]|nr:M3 family metallopeptidase [candidate division Zixibacteria bacterium]
MTKRRNIFSLASVLLLAVLCLPAAAQDNPFLVTPTTPFQTPPFDRIQIDHYLPAIQEGINRHQAEIDAIVDDPQAATFDNTIVALDMSGQLLDNVAAVFYSLLGTNNSPERQEIANQMAPLLSAHNDNIALNEKLFTRVKSVYDERAALKLSEEQLFLLENTFRGFLRSGALLDDTQKARLRDINREHALLVLKFEDNVLAETNDSYIIINDKADLSGLPDGVIAMAEEEAKAMNLPGKWVFTTQKPSWIPFLQYAAARDQRQALYTAYFMRGDRDNDHDNKAILQKILTLREERSRMLGYATPAAFYLEERMAKTPETVNAFLMRVWKPARARAKTEVTDMQAIIDGEQGGFALSSWDWWYYTERLRKARYDLDDSALRPYFKLENVRMGAFTLAEKLYGLKFTERQDISVYHPGVKVYEVKEKDGRLLGILYMDPFFRDSKQAGAWSGSYREAFYQNGKRVIPFATLVCNFTKPTSNTPSLLNIDEVETLFHEFGHALNTLLANGTYRSNFAPQDVVELPSQIMENWVLEPELLKLYAKHYQTGEVIPTALVDKLNDSRQFNQGFETVEYVAAAILDMAWHSLGDALNVNVTNFETKTMADIGLIPEILPRYRSTYFTHIHGGYEAGYYSYFWSEVLDGDAFDAFKETSLFDKKTAASFRKNILEKLGTVDAMTLYMRFRGHEPTVEPFLKRRGLL